MSRLRRLLLLLLLLGLGSLSRKAGAREPLAVSGLPPLNIAALAISAERLFVGGFDDGLFIVEHDGSARRFEDPALSPHINALVWSAPTRALWLGTARGLVRCQPSRAAACQRVGPTSAVHALLLRDDGSLLAGGDAGLIFVRGPEIRLFGKKQRAPFRSVWALAESDGQLFVGTTSGLFWGEPRRFAASGGNLGRASLVLGDLPDDWVTALLRRGDRLFVGTYNAGVVSFTLGSGQPLGDLDLADATLGYVNPAGLAMLDDTRLAVATMDGLRAGPLTSTALIATKTRDVTAIVPGTNGGYWVGTRHGLEWLASL